MTTTTTATSYVIRDARRAGYVTGYANDVQRVQVSNTPKRAARFDSPELAHAFIAQHSHQGSGLIARSAFVQPVTL